MNPSLFPHQWGQDKAEGVNPPNRDHGAAAQA